MVDYNRSLACQYMIQIVKTKTYRYFQQQFVEKVKFSWKMKRFIPVIL